MSGEADRLCRRIKQLERALKRAGLRVPEWPRDPETNPPGCMPAEAMNAAVAASGSK